MAGYIPPHSILNNLDLSGFEVTPKPKDVPEDRSWDELNEAQKDTREGLGAWLSLVNMGVGIYPSLTQEDQKQSILNYGKQLVDTHNKILGELESLKTQHEGRTGGVSSEEEMVQALTLGNQYHERVLAPFAGAVADYAIPLQDILETAIEGMSEEEAQTLIKNVAQVTPQTQTVDDSASPQEIEGESHE